MCACRFIAAAPSSLAGNFDNIIPNSFFQGDSKAQFQFLFCINQDKFSRAFKDKVGMEVKTYKDVDSLALMHDKGDDVKLLKEDFMKIAKAIPFTTEEINNASCKTAFAI